MKLRNALPAVIAATVVSVPLVLVSQTRSAAPAAAASSRLSGRVMTMDAAAEPVRNAIVTITAPELPRGRSVMTDGDGRFEFANLPAARYAITAAKASYVRTEFGAAQPGRPGTAVRLEAGQSIANLTVRLARGSVITGRLTRPNGQPATAVRVVAVAARDLREGAATGEVDTRSITDDRGVYRIFGLAPGNYAIVAMMGAGERDVLTTATVEATLAQLRQRTTTQTVAAPTGTAALAAPLFYPGTASADDAQAVSVAIGEERGGVDMIVDHVRAHTIDGVIVTDGGASIESVGLAIVSGGLRMPTGLGAGPRLTLRPGADGRFQIASVRPGRHTLIAWTTTTGPPQSPGRGTARTTAPVTALHASADLAVTQDLSGVTLTLRPVARVAGRIVFDGSSAPPPDLTRLRITLSPVTSGNVPVPLNGVSTAPLGRQASVLLDADGRFDVTAVMPNTYALAVAIPGVTPGSGWWLRSAMADGRDLLDTQLDVGANLAGLTTTVVVTLSDRHTELAGRLQAPSGQPASDCVIVAFTTDRTLWRPGARRVQSARPGTDGVYAFKDLPPGEYFLAALTDLDPESWGTPEFLSQIAATGAIRIAIGEGERRTQDLRLRVGLE